VTTGVESGAGPSLDAGQAIAALEERLARTPQAHHPYEHAALSYRLGLAYAESPEGAPAENLRRALACYDAAAKIFDPRHDPVEHARVLNAAGAAQRALGDRVRAAGLFGEAARLLAGRGRDGERAAALNNLGLARTELGDVPAAVSAFTDAAGLFDTGTAEGRRGRSATLLNRGLAHGATGGEAGLEAALADYEQARADVDAEEAPYHWALVHHSIGVALVGQAGLRPAEQGPLLAEARRALTESLTIFTPASFPFQYSLAKHNLGLAHLAAGGDALRRGLACFEDALLVLDHRAHEAAWRQVYASLTRAEEALAERHPGISRPDHFAMLLASCEPGERDALLRERLLLLLALPAHRRHAALVEAARATTGLEREALRRIIEAELVMLMEWPNDFLEAALRARFEAHGRLDPATREEADRALDQAVGDALGGPQRMFVRDFLSSIGFERP
jgi:tetratricopeptide (TPR) repeat protein